MFIVSTRNLSISIPCLWLHYISLLYSVIVLLPPSTIQILKYSFCLDTTSNSFLPSFDSFIVHLQQFTTNRCLARTQCDDDHVTTTTRSSSGSVEHDLRSCLPVARIKVLVSVLWTLRQHNKCPEAKRGLIHSLGSGMSISRHQPRVRPCWHTRRLQQKRAEAWQGISSGDASGEATSGNYVILQQGADRILTNNSLNDGPLSSCPLFHLLL